LKSSVGSIARRNQFSGLWFVFPSAVLMLALITYPLMFGGYISLFDTNLINRWDFVGLKYYAQALTDASFRRDIGTTFLYTFLVVAGNFIIGMALALLLNRNIRGRWLFRSILLLPWLIPDVVIALLWKWLFNPMYGLVNHYLTVFGFISQPLDVLGSPDTAMAGIVIASIWKGFPFVMVLLLAGLQSIPKELYEAAEIDGGNALQRFRHVTLPGIMPVLIVALILDTVWFFKHYTVVWLMTSGGPINATNVISISIYQTAFADFQFGRAAAMAVIVFVICYVIGFVYRRLTPAYEN